MNQRNGFKFKDFTDQQFALRQPVYSYLIIIMKSFGINPHYRSSRYH